MQALRGRDPGMEPRRNPRLWLSRMAGTVGRSLDISSDLAVPVPDRVEGLRRRHSLS